MANNYSMATVSPELPATLFNDAELCTLEVACGLSCNRIGENLYFFAEECFCEEGEDDDDEHFDCLALIQEKLRQLDPVAYPHIIIHGATFCSKMRPDEFGGFAHFITREAVRSISTWQWLHEQMQLDAVSAGAVEPAHQPKGIRV